MSSHMNSITRHEWGQLFPGHEYGTDLKPGRIKKALSRAQKSGALPLERIEQLRTVLLESSAARGDIVHSKTQEHSHLLSTPDNASRSNEPPAPFHEGMGANKKTPLGDPKIQNTDKADEVFVCGVPPANTPLDVSVECQGQQFDFDVVFSPDVVNLLREKGYEFDMRTGEVVGKKGRMAISGVNDPKWPSWMINDQEWGVAGFPQERLYVELRDKDKALILNFVPKTLRTLAPDMEANEPYSVQTEWNGKVYEFDLVVSQEVAAWMNENYLRIDFDTGEIVQGADKWRSEIFQGAKSAYEEIIGRKAPPWIFQHHRYGLFGIPSETVFLDKTDTGWRFGGFPIQSDALFRQDHDVDIGHSDKKIIQALDWEPSVKVLRPNLKIEAPSEELADKAKALFEKVAGKANREFVARLPNIVAQQESVAEILTAMLGMKPNGQKTQKLIADAKEMCAPEDTSEWSLEDARNALQARMSHFDKWIDHEITLVVVPKGKHWAAMPHIKPHDRNRALSSDFIAACYSFPDETFVFLPEDSLVSDHSWLCEHELFHVVMEHLLSEEEVQKINALYEQTMKNNGPFARGYSGFNAKEFWATFGELFVGRFGSEGVEWFEKNQQKLFEIMCNATGQHPT